MNINETVIRIREAGGNASCVPMSEGNLLYKIIVEGNVVADGLSKEEAESIMKAAKNRVIID